MNCGDDTPVGRDQCKIDWATLLTAQRMVPLTTNNHHIRGVDWLSCLCPVADVVRLFLSPADLQLPSSKRQKPLNICHWTKTAKSVNSPNMVAVCIYSMYCVVSKVAQSILHWSLLPMYHHHSSCLYLLPFILIIKLIVADWTTVTECFGPWIFISCIPVDFVQLMKVCGLKRFVAIVVNLLR